MKIETYTRQEIVNSWEEWEALTYQEITIEPQPNRELRRKAERDALRKARKARRG